jgi:cysteine desulfurase
VLAALGLPKERIRSAVRVGLGRGTTEADVERAAERIVTEVRRLRATGAAAGLGR